MTTKFSFTMDWDAIEEGSKVLGKKSTAIKLDVHKLCVSTLNKWQLTGDASHAVSTAAKIMANVDAHYAVGISKWFQVYGGFIQNDDGETFTYTKTTITKEDVLKSKAQTFEQVSPPAKPKPLNLVAEIQKLITKAGKHMEKPVDGDEVDQETYKALRNVLMVAA